MKISRLYTEYIANWVSSGTLILRDKISSLGIVAGYDRVLTKKYVTKAWAVRYIPTDFQENLTALVRSEMFMKFPDVKTVIQYYGVSTIPGINNDTYKRQMAASEERYDRLEKLFESLSETDKISGKTLRTARGRFTVRKVDLKRAKDRFDSYSYVHKHRSEDGEFFNTYVLIQASAESNEVINKYRKLLIALLSGRGVIVSEIKGDMNKYLSNFGPAGYAKNPDGFRTVLLSDENLSYLVPYRSRGLLGGRGVLMGVDWLAKLPLVLNFLATSAAQIIVFIAKSGKGKTLAAQLAAMGFLAKGFHVSVTDMKGQEWNKLRIFCKPLEISMDGKKAKIVNTLRLDDLQVRPEDASYIYELAISATTNLFSIATNLQPNEGNIADLNMICDNCIRKYYSQISGFNPNLPKTFAATRHATYEGVLDIINDFKASKSLTESQREIAALIFSRVSAYFGRQGRYRITEDNEISLGDVISSKFVIYEFNKNIDRTMTLLDNVKVFMAQHLSRKKHYVRSVEGLHSVEIYEELQRVEEDMGSNTGHSSELLTTISSTVSGSRSDNVTVMLLLNSISTFDNPNTNAIASNITTVIVGAVNEEDVPRICKRFNCSDLEEYIYAVSTDTSPNMRNTFAIKFDNGEEVNKTIYKVVIPEYIEKELRQRDVDTTKITKEEEILNPIL